MTERPWRVLLHPLVRGDILAIARHVKAASGSNAAGQRRIAEVEAMLEELSRTPMLGAPLSGTLEGFRRRHGGQRRQLTLIYRVDEAARTVRVLLVAFGGAAWEARAAGRG